MNDSVGRIEIGLDQANGSVESFVGFLHPNVRSLGGCEDRQGAVAASPANSAQL